MKAIRHSILAGVFAVLFHFSATLSAQEILPYAYRNSIDFGFGMAGASFNVPGLSQRTPFSFSAGFSMDTRYTRWFIRNFGLSASAGIDIAGMRKEDFDIFLKGLPSSDGEFTNYGTRPDMFHASLWIGPAYRYDVSRWSFRARLMAGYTSTSTYNGGSYFKKSTDEWVLVRDITFYGEDKGNISVTPSVQVCFTPSTHFYFSVEASLLTIPGGYKQEYKKIDVRYAEPDGTWFSEYDVLTNKPITWDCANAVIIKNHASFPVMPSLRFTLGWNIGWNVHERNR
ncbi:MAG: hypothetical protein MJZ16_05890 [Bacteroidales bacterium]|nr:hypothetical protein [Bacteroidales bacterium]